MLAFVLLKAATGLTRLITISARHWRKFWPYMRLRSLQYVHVVDSAALGVKRARWNRTIADAAPVKVASIPPKRAANHPYQAMMNPNPLIVMTVSTFWFSVKLVDE